MLTIFIEIIMSVFIANFKASEHPIITIIVQGFLLALIIFLFGIYLFLKEQDKLNLGFLLAVSLGIGFLVTIFLLIIEIIFNWVDKKK